MLNPAFQSPNMEKGKRMARLTSWRVILSKTKKYEYSPQIQHT